MVQVLEKTDERTDIKYNPLILRDIMGELFHIKNKDEKSLRVGFNNYSVNELISEINNKTELGFNFYKAHVDLTYKTRSANVNRLSLKEVSRLALIECEAKRLGIDH